MTRIRRIRRINTDLKAHNLASAFKSPFASFPRAAWECSQGALRHEPQVAGNASNINLSKHRTRRIAAIKLRILVSAGSQAPAWEFGAGSSSFQSREAKASSGFPSWSLGTSVTRDAARPLLHSHVARGNEVTYNYGKKTHAVVV